MFLKRVYQFVISYSNIFSRCCPYIWSSSSKTANISWNNLGSTYWLQSIWKNNTNNFCLFVYFTKWQQQQFSLLETVQSSQDTSYLEMSHFCTKFWYSFFSSNIPLYIGKNLWKNYAVLEIELKTYTPVSLKFVFEKIKFKVMHYIQSDFICQHSGLSKDQISKFKSLVINHFILKCCHILVVI